MGVKLHNIPYYYCICDNCKKTATVNQTPINYNGAQAVRSLGWSFGKNQKVFCNECRKRNYNDHYKWNK